jgi:phosphoribosylformylglycinamidine (FGAM) synthase-like enzyme
VLGIVGLLEDASRTVTRLFKSAGAAVVLLGEHRGELGGSEYLATLHDTVAGVAPHLDLERERALQQVVIRAVRDGLVESAHDCAEGGLAVTLAECCFDTPFGITADVPGVTSVPDAFRVNATLFGESASRIVVSVRAEQRERLIALAGALGVPAQLIGETGGSRIALKVDGKMVIDVEAAAAERAWATAIETKMQR